MSVLAACGGATTLPTAPESLNAAVDGAAVELSWPAVPTATSYLLERKSGAEAFLSLVPQGLTGTAYRDAALTQGTRYTWRVRAVNQAGVSDASPEVSATPVGLAGTGGGSASGGTGAGGGAALPGLRATDVLKAEGHSQGTDITLPVDTEVCLEVSVLHQDGTREMLHRRDGLVFSVTSSTPGMVALGQPEDCVGLGLIGLAEGVGTATVMATENGISLTATLVVTVQAGSITLTPIDAMALAAGERTTFNTSGWLRFKNSAGRFVNDGQLVPKWVTVTAADTGIANVVAQDGPLAGGWWLRGIAPGATSGVLHYVSPHRQLSVDWPVTVVVRPPVERVTIAWRAFDGHTLGFQDQVPGSCVIPDALASATVGTQYVTWDASSTAAWSRHTSNAAAVTDGTHPRELCFTGNVLTETTACLDGVCDTAVFTSFSPGAIDHVQLTGASLSAQTVVPVDPSEARNIFCPEVSATLVLSGGETLDVTRWVDWSLTTEAFSTEFGHGDASLGPSPWGTFTPGPPVTPCFSIRPHSMHAWVTSGVTTMSLHARWTTFVKTFEVAGGITVAGSLMSY